MDKKIIREKVLEMRRCLTSKYIEENSYNVFEKLSETKEILNAKEVLIYSDFDGEVKTANLAGWLLYKGKNVYLPVVENKEMFAANIKNAKLELNKFGVAQPEFKTAQIIEPDKLDIVIVPGIAFDRNKNRVGYGQGYYDIYLKKAVNAIKIGLLYDFQLQKIITTDEHDVKMDMLIMPDEIF